MNPRKAALLAALLEDDEPQAKPPKQEKPKQQSDPAVGFLLTLAVLVVGLWAVGGWVKSADTANMVRQQRAVEEALKQEVMR